MTDVNEYVMHVHDCSGISRPSWVSASRSMVFFIGSVVEKLTMDAERRRSIDSPSRRPLQNMEA